MWRSCDASRRKRRNATFLLRPICPCHISGQLSATTLSDSVVASPPCRAVFQLSVNQNPQNFYKYCIFRNNAKNTTNIFEAVDPLRLAEVHLSVCWSFVSWYSFRQLINEVDGSFNNALKEFHILNVAKSKPFEKKLRALLGVSDTPIDVASCHCRVSHKHFVSLRRCVYMRGRFLIFHYFCDKALSNYLFNSQSASILRIVCWAALIMCLKMNFHCSYLGEYFFFPVFA